MGIKKVFPFVSFRRPTQVSCGKCRVSSAELREKWLRMRLQSELAALKQELEQEMKTLAKLNAFVQTAQAGETPQKVAFVPR